MTALAPPGEITGTGRQNVLLAFGTRPEAVKMAPVVQALRNSDRLRPIICLTGQHREMVEQILPLFDIRADIDLDLMSDNQTPSQIASAVFRDFPDILASVSPSLLLVQGDTTTAMAAAVAGHYARVPVGHVEAGLRTGHLYQPFPEEANRKVISAVTTLHFAPTERARQSLLAEGIDRERVSMTGNTVVDALQFLLPRLPATTPDRSERVILVTAHRRESFGRPLEAICHAIARIARSHPDVEVVYPVHPNPNVRGPVYSILGEEPRVRLIEPLDYLAFISRLADCYMVLTDSGGVQEEAPVLGKPVLVMRDHTERPEAVEAGCALLVGTDEDAIAREASRLLDDPRAYARMSVAASPFGDGHAAERTVAAMEAFIRQQDSTPVGTRG